MMDAPEVTDWDLRPMWRWRRQSSYPTWSSRTLPHPHHEVKSNSPFPLILHRACDSPGTNRMRQKRCRVTPENSPWEEMQLLPCELEHIFGALHHYMRSLRLLCQEEAQAPLACCCSEPDGVPTDSSTNCQICEWRHLLMVPAAGRRVTQPLCLPIWGCTVWSRGEHFLLCLFWIPDPRNLWVEVTNLF